MICSMVKVEVLNLPTNIYLLSVKNGTTVETDPPSIDIFYSTSSVFHLCCLLVSHFLFQKID